MTAASCFSAFSASSFMVAIEFRLKVAYSCFPNSPFWYSLQTQMVTCPLHQFLRACICK